jgi:hypothetical protein
LYCGGPGAGPREDRALATEAGFHHHFIKPADPRAIHAVISAFDMAGEQAVSGKSH